MVDNCKALSKHKESRIFPSQKKGFLVGGGFNKNENEGLLTVILVL